MIQGPNIRFRLIRNDEDELLFACMRDWPADGRGPFTRRRAIDTLDLCVRENQLVEYPLTGRSDWFVTFVIETEGRAIGVTRGRIWQRTVWVEWLALHPDERGRGLFREVHLCWSALCFEVLQGNRIGFATREGTPAVEGLIDRYTGEEADRARGPRQGRLETDAPKRKWLHTRADYERDRETAFKDREGREISFRAE